MKNRIIQFFLLLSFFAITSNVNAKNWDDIFDRSEYYNAKISPDGKYLAVSVLLEGKAALAFLDRESLEVIGSSKFQGSYEVGQYHWINNERVVINMVKRFPWLEQPQSLGELFAVNYDGSKGKMIYGYQAGEMQTGSRIKKKESIYGWGSIVDTLPEDKNHILISSTPMSKTGESLATVHKLNVYTGIMKKKLAKSPVSYAKFLTNNKGEVKVVTGTDKSNNNQLYVRKEGLWEKVPTENFGNKIIPLSISDSGDYLYSIDDHNQDLRGIFKLSLEDYSHTPVFTDKKVNVTDVEMTSDNRSAYAIRIDDGYPAYLILNKKVEEAKVFKDLLKSFPYNKVKITSKTENGEFYIVSVSSDIDPGRLYIFDKKLNKLNHLFKFKPNFKDSDFAQVEPIKFESSDGKVINGFFTQAQSTKKGKLAPVVVLVHGGPHGVRDYWGFSSQIQYLVLNGYSVLQVNFRGSGGYGVEYEAAGYKNWGSLTQQDIYDGYHWLVKNNKAQDNRVCIMGASFGAYSAIQSAAIYPDTYQCAIANAGVYDLELLFEEGDVQNRRAGLSYLKRVLGTDEKNLKSMSPVNYAEKIKIPLLLAHGEDDKRAPYEHAERLRDALDKANKPYEWFVMDKEGHGFYNPKNQKAYMRKVVGFLDKHLL